MSKIRSMEALENALCSTVFTFPTFFFAEAPDRLSELSDEQAQIAQQLNGLLAKADAEGRELTDDEKREMDTLSARFDAAGEEIERRKKLININAALARGTGRVTDHDDQLGDDPPAPAANQDDPHAASRVRPAAIRARVPAQPIDHATAGRWGWGSFGQFAMSVRQAALPNGRIDPKLIRGAPTDYGQEGVGEDGGFAVPPDFRRDIMVKVMGEASLVARTDQLETSTNQIVLPKDETTPWQTSGGLQAYWENEGGQLTQSKPVLDQSTIRLNKLTGLVPVTSELLEDAPALTTYLRRKVPEKFTARINTAIIRGTGAGQPRGILNEPSLVTVLENSGQTANTITMANIVDMYARLYTECRANAVWLINQDIETQLFNLSFPGTGTAVPVYLPANGLAATPFGTLMGKPVIPIEACSALGTIGDILLVDLRQYMTVTKVGGIRQDVSIHLFFDYDVMTFRFIMRFAGQGWWSAAITPQNGSNTRGCFVALHTRS